MNRRVAFRLQAGKETLLRKARVSLYLLRALAQREKVQSGISAVAVAYTNGDS